MSRTRTSRPALELAIVDALDSATEPLTNHEIWLAVWPAALTDTTTRHAVLDLAARGRVRRVTVTREVRTGFGGAARGSRTIRTSGFTTSTTEEGANPPCP